MNGFDRVPGTELVGDSSEAQPGRAGFSMVEVIIALLVLTIGVLGLAGSTAHIVRQVTFLTDSGGYQVFSLSDKRTIDDGGGTFQSVIDGLQSLPYDSVGSGVDTVGVFALSWTSTPDGPQSKVVRIRSVGPGMSSTGGGPVTNNPMQVDSFDFRVLRR